MDYDNDDYANDDWDGDHDEKSYQDEQRQPSDYDNTSEDQKKLKTHANNLSSSRSNNNEEKYDLESIESDEDDDLMLIDMIPEKRKEELGICDEFQEEIKKPNFERITSPFISKYEKAIVIGKRANQISKSSPIFVDISQSELKRFNALQIAEMEYQMGRIPMIVRRHLPDSTFEDWKLNELRKLPY